MILNIVVIVRFAAKQAKTGMFLLHRFGHAFAARLSILFLVLSILLIFAAACVMFLCRAGKKRLFFAERGEPNVFSNTRFNTQTTIDGGESDD